MESTRSFRLLTAVLMNSIFVTGVFSEAFDAHFDSDGRGSTADGEASSLPSANVTFFFVASF